MDVRVSTWNDLSDIKVTILAAFDEGEREEVAQFALGLLDDPTAQPVRSLVAESEEGTVVGHVLFSAVRIEGAKRPVHAAILAPLAVQPEHQSKGVGAMLVREGLSRLRADGVDLVCVLGYPGYYGRFGFEPAGRLGLEAMYPITEGQADAWMVQALRHGVEGEVTGKVVCADTLNRPELWLE